MAGSCSTFDNRFTLAEGRLHLSFELGGKWIAYAYIRKNACSTFKRALGFSWDVDIGEVVARHPHDPRRRHDAAIFVYRDPIERLLSLYRSKIIERRGDRDILASYREVMREEPSSFERFVEFAILERDPHCWTQRSHLARMKYIAIPMGQLHEGMVSLVGAEAAEPFITKVNESGPRDIAVSERARQLVRSHYVDDYRMIASLTRKPSLMQRLRGW